MNQLLTCRRRLPIWRCLLVLAALTTLAAACSSQGTNVTESDLALNDVRSDLEQQEDSVSLDDTLSDLGDAVPWEVGEPDQAIGDWADDETQKADGVPNDGMEPEETLDVPFLPDAEPDGTDSVELTDEVEQDQQPDVVEVGDVIPDQADSDAVELWPIPELDEEVALPCQAAMEEEWYFQFLDNICGEKVWPSTQDRDRKCAVSDSTPFMTLADGSVVEYKPSSESIEWDTESLQPLMPSGMRMVVILIKRIDGVPYYRYLSNDTHDIPQQPWSTTKILAAANAAATVRIESNYTVGLTATAGEYKIGDLITSMCNYDESPFTSNGLGKYFHNVGGRARANDLIHELWLNRPEEETFGGNYGESAPAVPYTWQEADGSSVTLTPDSATGYANNLSLYTLAEAVKRLVLHREEANQRLPGIQWKDLKVLLYGAPDSDTYGMWGGMTQDTAIYLQSGHDMDYIEERSHGQWMIFSKLGLGSEGQFLNVGYACWPALDENQAPIPGLGREFVIAAHLDEGGDTWAERDRLLAQTYRSVILRIVDGRL